MTPERLAEIEALFKDPLNDSFISLELAGEELIAAVRELQVDLWTTERKWDEAEEKIVELQNRVNEAQGIARSIKELSTYGPEGCL